MSSTEQKRGSSSESKGGHQKSLDPGANTVLFQRCFHTTNLMEAHSFSFSPLLISRSHL